MPPHSVTALSSMSANKIPSEFPGVAKESSPVQNKPPIQPQPVSSPLLTPNPTKNNNQVAAQPKKSVFKFLPIILLVLVVLGSIGYAVTRFLGGNNSSGSVSISDDEGQGGRQVVPGNQTKLVYWGLWEPSEVLNEVISDYQADHPGIAIEYVKQSHQDYRERLQTAVATGTGPDIFRFHASWTPMLSEELAPIPASVYSATEFKSTFYPVASELLQSEGQIVGVPLMYDGLVLLYNQDILDSAGESVPQTWAELRALATRLTVKSTDGVERAGVALGNATNVEHFSDILALLILQNGGDLSDPDSAETRDALLFYTNFVKVDGVWSDSLPSSSVALARGDVAMIFAPSWRIHEILATNPDINIGAAPVPKLSDERLAWATFWAEGINSKGKNQSAAGEFLKYMSSPEVLRKMYDQASEVRSFGEIYPRVDMAEELAEVSLVNTYLSDAPYARGGYLSSSTHDNGINDNLIQYYVDAVNAVLGGKQVEDTLTTVSQGTTQVLRQYGAL